MRSTVFDVDDIYTTPIEKIALVASASQVAKQVTVTEDGVGEDLPFSLMVWRDSVLTAICQLDSDLSDESPGERLARTVSAAAVCRWGFDATAFTFVTEGYCATDPALVHGDEPLAEQFVHNRDVHECLTLTHIEAGNVYLSAQPYRYALGRVVEWGESVQYEPMRPGTNMFLSSMVEVLLTEVEDPFIEDVSTWQELVAADVARWGFHVHWGLDGGVDVWGDGDVLDLGHGKEER